MNKLFLKYCFEDVKDFKIAKENEDLKNRQFHYIHLDDFYGLIKLARIKKWLVRKGFYYYYGSMHLIKIYRYKNYGQGKKGIAEHLKDRNIDIKDCRLAGGKKDERLIPILHNPLRYHSIDTTRYYSRKAAKRVYRWLSRKNYRTYKKQYFFLVAK